MRLHEARRLWMGLSSDMRARVLAGETIKVAHRTPVPSLFNPKPGPIEEVKAHTFRAIRTESFVGAIVTVYCDDEVIHVWKERT